MESIMESQLVVIAIMLLLFMGLMLFVCRNSEEMSEEERERGELIHTWYEQIGDVIYQHMIYEYTEETIEYERVS